MEVGLEAFDLLGLFGAAFVDLLVTGPGGAIGRGQVDVVVTVAGASAFRDLSIELPFL